MGWRQIFFVVAFASIIMGVVYLLFRDYGATNRVGSGRARLAQGFTSYKRILKNRNMMLVALVFMVGAAGAEGGINQTYFAPHLDKDFHYATLLIGIMITSISVGQIAGPIFFGWLSDRLHSRVAVLQTSLALSSIGSLWIAWLDPAQFAQLVNLPQVSWQVGDSIIRLGSGEVTLLLSLLAYSSVTSSRGTLTQTIVADTATDEDRDAAFSLYFLLGFLSQPFWLLVTGLLMDGPGFSAAMSRLSISYVLAIILLCFVRDLQKKPAEVVAAGT
jgi:MFS family permease